MPLPRPAHLQLRYGEQFSDPSVAARYHTRPPYPPVFFSVLSELHAPGPRRILDLGCGAGDVTLGLLNQAEHIDAIDPSAEMLAIARRREHSADSRIRWIHAHADAQRCPLHLRSRSMITSNRCIRATVFHATE